MGRARARMEEANPQDVEEVNDHLAIAVRKTDSLCKFGNDTLNLGDRLQFEDPCEECVCSTPPEITCTKHVCPPPPGMGSAICQEIIIPGQCCPDYSCVSANPPFIDVCAVTYLNILVNHTTRNLLHNRFLLLGCRLPDG